MSSARSVYTAEHQRVASIEEGGMRIIKLVGFVTIRIRRAVR
jgi:hypothetical protein